MDTQKHRRFQRRNTMIFTSLFLAFSRAFADHFAMLKSLRVSLNFAVENSATCSEIGRLEFTRLAPLPQAFSSSDRPAAGASCGAARGSSNPFSGFAVAARRAEFAAPSWDASSPDAFGCFLAGLRLRAPPSPLYPDRA